MVSSYTANLATFLVIENKVSKINGVEDLKDCGKEGFECPVRFGAKRGGATYKFFKVKHKKKKRTNKQGPKQIRPYMWLRLL